MKYLNCPRFIIGMAFGGLLFTAYAMLFAAGQPKPLRFPPEEGEATVLVERVVDGDTVHFYWLVKDTARLWGMNAPELPSQEGIKAKERLTKILPSQPRAVIKGRDKYGRHLLELYDNENSINDQMIREGHAVPYLRD